MSKAPFRGNSTPREVHQVSRLARRPGASATAATPARTVIVHSPSAGGSIDAVDPLVYEDGAISLPSADAATDGYLTAPDWTAFAAKEPSLGFPAADGQALVSTAAGIRSWAALPTVPSFADSETPAGTVNGTNAVFTLAHAPLTGSTRVYKGASPATLQRLAPSQYSVTGSTLTFTAAPATGSALLIDYRY